MRFVPLLGALLVVLVLSQAPARAQEDEPPPGTTILGLSETASRRVTEDLLVAMLEARAVAATAAAAQARVNEAMEAARRQAEQVSGVELETGHYMVYVDRPYPEPLRPEPAGPGQADREERWIASQALVLRSSEGEALLGLVGRLQGEGLGVQQLEWRVADATRQRVERELTGEALAALRSRAGMAAEAMGMELLGWKRLNLDSAGGPIRPFAERAVAMAADAPPPVAIPGEADVQISVSGEALLR